MNPEDLFEDYPLRHELDVEILMHREVHFGGNFKFMLDYYSSHGKGVKPEFEFDQIRNLAEFEQLSQKNPAALLLSGPEAEKVAAAKEAYKTLRVLYEQKNPRNKHPLLIANLILSEEEDPVHEITAIVNEKGAIVPSLLELLKAEDFYDPLFPGYGQAPMLAAKCLGLIGDKRAIISLFEAIGGEDFFNEDIILQALKLIGDPAKKFLLQVVRGRPLNFDNERAAIALIHFKDDPQVSSTCLKLLLDPNVRKDFALSTYLALICEGLNDPELRNTFLQIGANPETASPLKRDIKAIAKTWENEKNR